LKQSTLTSFRIDFNVKIFIKKFSLFFNLLTHHKQFILKVTVGRKQKRINQLVKKVKVREAELAEPEKQRVTKISKIM